MFYVQGIPHKIRKGLAVYFSPGDYVAKGQLMASGRVRYGDHIFVDKVRYNFARPKRGDIVVFSTDFIHDVRIKPNTFYIKRLAALPGERVRIEPPYLVVDGAKVTEPYPFHRLLTDHGYSGYTLAKAQTNQSTFLAESQQERLIDGDSFLPLGDNTSWTAATSGPSNARALSDLRSWSTGRSQGAGAQSAKPSPDSPTFLKQSPGAHTMTHRSRARGGNARLPGRTVLRP